MSKDKRSDFRWILLALIMASCFIQEKIVADTVDDRLNDMLNDYLAAPYPDPTGSDAAAVKGKACYAMLCLLKNTDVTTANIYVNWIQDNFNAPDNASWSGADTTWCYMMMPCLLRTYLDPTCNGRLTASARDDLEDIFWRYIHYRSTISDAQGSVWRIRESENHDVMRISTFLLAAQALEGAGTPYGPTRTLNDGYTIKQHRLAWENYWGEYLRQRAREGINCEIASPIYAKYTLQCYYNVRDLTSSDELAYMAENFITLYWADTASEFLPSIGIRGGAETRCYKDSYLTSGTKYSFRHLTYCYDWHDIDLGVQAPEITIIGTSSYRIPASVSACAAAVNKSPYLYTSRRFGMGGVTGSSPNLLYTVNFYSNQRSFIRRDSYVTPDYVLGSLSFDTSKDFVELIDQNRALGLFCSSGVDDRLVFHGKATTGTTANTEIYSACGNDCTVIARDPGVVASDGTRIFVSYGNLWNNRTENDGGWFFTNSGGTYVGIRIATGTTAPYYVIHSVTEGKMLDFEDMWSPAVIQTGRASNYASFAEFKTSVKANSFSYVSGKLTYTSENGDTFEIWRNSSTLPEINNTPVNLHPLKTYGSPYISSDHGSELVRVMYPGYSDVVLYFGNLKTQRDDLQTVGLWHMDSTIAYGGNTCVPDDDSQNTIRDDHLIFYSGDPSLTTGDGGRFDEALDLDGDDFCTANNSWNNYSTVKCDVWFYPRSSSSLQILAGVASTWELHAGSATCTFYVWDTNLTSKSISIGNVSLNTWHYASAICDQYGHMTLILDGEIVETDHDNPMRLRASSLYIGNKPGYTRYFNGLIDELKVTVCPNY